jgi:hypothetical protein
MDWSASRKLQVTEHRYRRDSGGRLVAFVKFLNVSDKAYIARIRVKFADAQGLLEESPLKTHMHRFPPGATSMEWTSSTPDTQGYTIEVGSGRLLQW